MAKKKGDGRDRAIDDKQEKKNKEEKKKNQKKKEDKLAKQAQDNINNRDPLNFDSAENAYGKLLPRAKQEGQDLADKFYSDGSLGRLDEGRTEEETSNLGRLMRMADEAGVRPAEMVDAIARMKSGLEGFSAQENNAMRDSMNQNISRALATGQSALARAQGISRTRGASAAAQAQNLARSSMQDRANNERDLFVQNAQEKDKRLQNYTNTLRGVEGEEFGRKTTAEGMYQNQSNLLTDGQRQRQQFNLGQGAAEKAGQAASYVGGMGTYLGNVMGMQGMQLGDQNSKLAAIFQLMGQRSQDENQKKALEIAGG